MSSQSSQDKWLAIFFIIAALLILFVWIPMDTDTGMVEKVRRKLVIGDALAPSLAAIIICLGGVLLLLKPTGAMQMGKNNLLWLGLLFGLFVVATSLMRYAGPVVTHLLSMDYRPLRSTAPWHYIGFVLGGAFMVGGLTSIVDKKFSHRNFILGLVAALVIALLYDVPFDDLVLPPNGDV